MSASKAVLGFSQSVVVDTGEKFALPGLVKDAYERGGSSIPIVIFTDPGMTQIYGSYNHPAMKSQQYGTIFKDARAKIRKSIHKEPSPSATATNQKSSESTAVRSKNGPARKALRSKPDLSASRTTKSTSSKPTKAPRSAPPRPSFPKKASPKRGRQPA